MRQGRVVTIAGYLAAAALAAACGESNGPDAPSSEAHAGTSGATAAGTGGTASNGGSAPASGGSPAGGSDPQSEGGHPSPNGGESAATGGFASNGSGGASACAVQAPTECPDPAPKYADVQPIFATRCVICHGEKANHWPLNSYGHVASWRDTIIPALLTCAMPPADAGVALAVDESELILKWIRCGMPP